MNWHLRLVHTYNASISASMSISTRKSMCELKWRTHECKHKHKHPYACVVLVHTYFFLCLCLCLCLHLCLCLCLCHMCEPAFRVWALSSGVSVAGVQGGVGSLWKKCKRTRGAYKQSLSSQLYCQPYPSVFMPSSFISWAVRPSFELPRCNSNILILADASGRGM